MATTNARMQQLIGTTAEWAANDIVINSGEIAVEILADNTIAGKVGDGSNVFSALQYAFGNGVTINTDQTITGLKTIDNELHFLNQNDGTSKARIFYIVFPDPLFSMGPLEPGSDTVVAATRDNGDFQNLFIAGQEQQLFFGGGGSGKLIADYGGVAGRTWGAVNSDGTAAYGIRYTPVRNQVGWYSLAFDDAAFNLEQTVTANVISATAGLYGVTVELVSATQADIRIVDSTGTDVDAAFSFVRIFASEEYTAAPTSASS